MAGNFGSSNSLAFIFLILCLTYAGGNPLNRFQNEAKEQKEMPEPEHCHGYIPCGWSVYSPFTNTIEYFMPNTCICKEGLDCVRMENDVSLSAFVHNCRNTSALAWNIF